MDKIDSFLQDVQYRSLMVNSASFNVRLTRDRKTRLPFLDSQTGIVQKPNQIELKAMHRMPGINFGQIYIYPAQRWYRKRRSYLSLANQSNPEAASATEHTIVAVENPIATMSNEDSSSFDSKGPMQSDMFFYEETPYMDDDEDEPDNEDDDTYSTRSSKKRKRPSRPRTIPKITRGRKKREPTNYKIITDADDDNPGKPYECSLCGARYKTRQGLSYHLSHTHRANSSSGSSGPPNVMVARPIRTAISDPQQTPSHSLVQQQLYQHTETPPEYYQQSVQPKHYPTTPPNLIPSPKPVDSLQGLTDFQDNYIGFMNTSIAPPSTSAVVPTDMKPYGEGGPSHKTPLPEKKPIEPEDASQIASPEADAETCKKDRRATPNQYCDFCLGTPDYNNKTGEADEMVSCADCGRSGHLTCLQFTSNMIISVKQYPWQCLECKCCTLCGTSENDDKLLFCDDCDRGYHLYCLETPLSEPPEGEWSCKLCQQQFHRLSNH